MTTWLPVPGFEGLYDVSDDGEVRSWRPYHGTPVPRLLKPVPSTGGYPRVDLRSDGERLCKGIHHLVMLAFVGPCPPGLETRHLNGDESDCRRANLAYGTRSENVLDAVSHGTHNNTAKTHCPANHPYDDDNTIHRNGERICRVCDRAASRRYSLSHPRQHRGK